MALPLLGLAGALGIGLSLGLLGSGGSILTVPVLAYLFGQDEKQAIAGSLLVVALVALTGAIAQVRRQRVDWTAVGWFGLPGVASASLGTFAGTLVGDGTQMLVFAGTMLAASVLLLRDAGPPAAAASSASPGPDSSAPRPPATLARLVPGGTAVGLLTGFVGVGGGFLIVPALVLILRMPIASAVGTSLVIITLNAASGFAANLPRVLAGTLTLDPLVLGVVTALGMVGSLAGGRLGARLAPRHLRRGFGLLLLPLAAVVLWNNLPRAG